MIAVLLLLLAAGTGHADTYDLVPNAVQTDNAAYSVTGCVAPKHQCIDEIVGGTPNDTDMLQVTGTGPFAITFELDAPTTVFEAQAAEVLVRARCSSPTGTLNFSARLLNSSNLPQGSTMNIWANSAMRNAPGLTSLPDLDQTTVNGLRLRITASECTSGVLQITAVSVKLVHTRLLAESLTANANRIGSPVPNKMDGCTVAWECISEIPWDSAINGNMSQWTNDCNSNHASYDFEMTTITYPVRAFVGLQTGVRALMSLPWHDTRIDLQSFWAGGNTTLFNPNIPNWWVNPASGIEPLTLTKAQVDDMWTRVTMRKSACAAMSMDGMTVIAHYIRASIVSGVARNAPGGAKWSECDGVTNNITIALDGVVKQSVPCDATTGAYSSSVTGNVHGSIVQAYLNDPTTASNGGVSYFRMLAEGSDATDMDVIKGEVRVDAESDAHMTYNSEFVGRDSALDADIPWTMSGGTITVAANTTFVIAGGVFTLSGADLSTPRMRTDVNGKFFNITTGDELTLTGSGTGACTAGTAARPLCLMDDYGMVSYATVYYTGTSATTIEGGHFNQLHFVPTSGSPTYHLGSTARSDFTLVEHMTIGTGSAAVTVSTTANSPNVSAPYAGGHVTINAGATLSGSGSGTIITYTGMSGAGNVSLTGGAVHLISAGAPTLNASGTLPGTPWQLATLILSMTGGGGPGSVTIPATSREIVVGTELQIGNVGDAYSTTLNASAHTLPLHVEGNLNITTRGALTAGSITEIGGNYTNAGTFTSGTGTLEFSGAGLSVITNTGTGTAHAFLVDTPSKIVQFATPFGITSQLLVDGGTTCVTPAALRSSVNGVARAITLPAASLTADFVSLRDLNFSAAQTAANAGDLGNNTNVTFAAATPCTAPTTPFTNTTNASAGTATPLDIDGSANFHMSVTNASGDTADRYKTALYSSNPSTSAIEALFAFENNGNDRSPTANPVSISGAAYTGGATNFGQALDFDGVNDVASATSNVAYDDATFTVETWMRAPAASANATPVLVGRQSGSTYQFRIWMDTASGQLNAGVTAGGAPFAASTSAAPWLDDNWHHIAMSVDGSNVIRLYVDGVMLDSTTYTGTLDMPAAPLRIGSSGIAGTYYDGLLDDVQFASSVLDTATISGYALTQRPHIQAIWTSPTYSTVGAALGASCASAARCSDIVYPGTTNIHAEGARYFLRHQVRTTSGLWSAIASSWFETGSAGITITAPSSVVIPPTAGGADQTTSFSVTTGCTLVGGCALLIAAPSDNTALGAVASSDSIPPITPKSPTAPAVWAALSPLGLGFTVLTSTSGKDTGRWGTGGDFSNLGLLKFQGASRSTSLLQRRPSTGSEVTSIGVRLNVPALTTAGSYSGTINLTAVPAP